LQDVILSMLPIVDNFDRAFQDVPKDVQANSWVTGIEFIHRQFEKMLADFQVTEIVAKGEMFNPEMHEAVGEVAASDKVKPQTVVEVVEKGYRIGEKVLRPARVRVASSS
jgi:molecular chaperone GrpE